MGQLLWNKALKEPTRDFLGGPMVENLPSNAGDMGLIPAWRTKTQHAAGQQGLCAATREACRPQLRPYRGK